MELIPNQTVLKTKSMNKYLIILTLLLVTNIACAQTHLNKISDAKKLEINKKMWIGKPLKSFLKSISLDIKSVKPAPNKNLDEVNRISFLFVPYDQYRKDKRNIEDKPTTITVVFNQNWKLEGEKCTYNKPGCTDWTKKDEKNLENLIIYDIYVVGKN